jgi:hypothetical protein
VDDVTNGTRPFVITADAPDNSLFVSDDGYLGIGTNLPAVQLEIKDGNTPAIRFYQDTSSGFPTQRWDIGGNEANFYIRDFTGAATMPFRIQPDAPTSSIHIRSTGYIGFGTSAPTAPLDLLTSGEPALVIARRSGGASVQFSAGTSSTYFGSRSNHDLHLIVDQDEKLTIDTDGNVGIGLTSPSHMIEIYNSGASNAYCDGGAWVNGSSRKGKENIKSLTTNDAVKTLKLLDPVRFNYKSTKDEEHIGFIAEDVPGLVATKDRKGISPMDIVAILTKVVQQQQKIIEDQQKRLTKLEKQLKH